MATARNVVRARSEWLTSLRDGVQKKRQLFLGTPKWRKSRGIARSIGLLIRIGNNVFLVILIPPFFFLCNFNISYSGVFVNNSCNVSLYEYRFCAILTKVEECAHSPTFCFLFFMPQTTCRAARSPLPRARAASLPPWSPRYQS